MASRGQSTKTKVFGAGSTSKPTLTTDTLEDLIECCYILPLLGNPDFATPELADPLKEDETSYFNYYDPESIDTVTLNLQKCVDGVFVTQHTFTDNTYGTFSDLGDEVIDGLIYISIKNINWSKVLVNFGAGIYRTQTDETTIFASEGIQHSESLVYELKTFTARNADRTVFFKIDNSGVLGDRFDPRKKFSFPANWQDGLRVDGTYGQDFRDFEKDFTIFNDGSKEYLTTKGIDKMLFHAERLSEDARRYFKNELMMANLIEVTNYGRNLANTHTNTPVQSSGEFAPVYFDESKLAGFIVEFTDAYENQEKLHQ